MDGTKGWNRPRVVEHLPATQRVWLVSDLHLGDGTPTDAFYGKDAELEALLDQALADDAVVVVNGDAIDFPQAWGFLRVVRAHRSLLTRMSDLGRQGRLYYVIGNHDYDFDLFRDLLHFRVCDELHLGDEVLVRHGYEYDPYITEMLEHGQWHTYIHHLVERALDGWIRLPLSEFYTWPNRVAFWLGHKVAVAARAAQWLGQRFDVDTPLADETLANLDFWSWGNNGDSMGIFRPAIQHLRGGPWRVIVCGHSHVPGVVRMGERAYANTGSWTFGSAQYAVWDGTDVTVRDWITGHRYEDELYARMIDGTLWQRSFLAWWRASYLGGLRFREGEARRGQIRSWEARARHHARLGALPPSRHAAQPPSRETR